jgi:hypothetical protein
MLAHGNYDTNELNNLPDYRSHPDNENPYGFLTSDLRSCRGYVTTFHLFMYFEFSYFFNLA